MSNESKPAYVKALCEAHLCLGSNEMCLDAAEPKATNPVPSEHTTFAVRYVLALSSAISPK
jgi:hypothetical protein